MHHQPHTLDRTSLAACRAHLRGKPLVLFDMLADGFAVPVPTLFDGLNGRDLDHDADPAQAGLYVQRWVVRLNAALIEAGWRAVRVGDDYLLALCTPAAPDTALMNHIRRLEAFAQSGAIGCARTIRLRRRFNRVLAIEARTADGAAAREALRRLWFFRSGRDQVRLRLAGVRDVAVFF